MTLKGFLAIALDTGCARKKKESLAVAQPSAPSPRDCLSAWPELPLQKGCPVGSFCTRSVLPYGCRPP